MFLPLHPCGLRRIIPSGLGKKQMTLRGKIASLTNLLDLVIVIINNDNNNNIIIIIIIIMVILKL